MRRTFHHGIPLLVFGAFLGLLAPARLVGHRGEPAPASYELVSPPNYDAMARDEAQGRLTADVIAGRLTLLEAAAAFKAIDASRFPPLADALPRVYPGMSQEEAFCRIVIRWVKIIAPPDRADDVVRRLETELDSRLKSGPLQLPEATADAAGQPRSEADSPDGPAS